MKIMAFSDLHAHPERAAALVEASTQADLVIGAGDFCNMRQGLAEALDMLSGLAAPMVAVPGNAESVEELRAAITPETTLLHGTGCRIGEIEMFGLGYSVPETPFGDWSCDLAEEAAAGLLATCDSADILILHSPPKGVADQTSSGLSVGSVAIRDAIERIQPQLAICGHIHESWGQTGRIGRTEIVNLGPVPNWFDF